MLAVRRKLKEIVNKGTVVIVRTDPPLLGMFVIGIVARQGGILHGEAWHRCGTSETQA